MWLSAGRQLLALLRSILSAAFGLAVALLIAAAAGESPLHVAEILYQGAFGTAYSTGLTLFYATPLILTGLAVAIPFKAGLFNIGAEGQLTMGALGAAMVGIYGTALPAPFSYLAAICIAMLFGGLWAGIAGAIRAWRGGHEVISTIMLNFVASALTSWLVLDYFRGENLQTPESSKVAQSFLITPFHWFEGAPAGWASIMAVVAAVVVALMFARSAIGFEVFATGTNEHAAAHGGIDVRRARFLAMCMGGACAGLVGIVEVLGNSGRFKIGFSPDYGFTGIAVALLARCNPIGIIPSALLFGALHKGSAELDLETEKITRDMALMMQASIIGFVTLEGFWQHLVRRPKPRRGHDKNKDMIQEVAK